MYARFLMLPVVAGAALLASVPAAAQDEYPPAEPVLTVSASTVTVGETVIVNGTGYEANEEIELSLSTQPLAAPQLQRDGAEQADPIAIQLVAMQDDQNGSAVGNADADGAFIGEVTPQRVGLATITATGLDSGLSASVVITVLPAGDALPETGTGLWSMLRIGAAVLGAGALLVLISLVWRRRNAGAGA